LAAGRLAQVGRRVAQPHLSPIEEAFSKLKTVLRRAAARTREALEQAIAIALDQITAQDAQGYFRHCGSISKLQKLTKYARCCIDSEGVGAAKPRLRLHQKRT
jgi:ERCC4-type nuclease